LGCSSTPDPTGELTALPQTLWLDSRSLLLMDGRGRGKEWEGGRPESEGKRRGPKDWFTVPCSKT